MFEARLRPPIRIHRQRIQTSRRLPNTAGRSAFQSAKPAAGSDNPHFADPDFAALRDYARDVVKAQPAAASESDTGWAHPAVDGKELAVPKAPAVSGQAEGHAQFADPELAALRDYAREIAGGAETSAGTFQVAEADNAFDALRDLLRKKNEPSPHPPVKPGASPTAGPALHQAQRVLCRRPPARCADLSLLSRGAGRGVRQNADGPNRQDPAGQARLRKLSRPRLGACPGRGLRPVPR